MAASTGSAGLQAQGALLARPGHAFYIAVAWLFAAIVFAGFSRSFYLNGWFARLDLTTLRIVHGAVATAWIVLLLAQTTLVAARRTDLHRRLGALGALVALAMVVVGLALALESGRHGFSNPGLPPPRIFLIVPLTDMVLFTGCVATALALRDRPDWHKRLMVLATLVILAPAFARLPVDAVRDHLPASAFALSALSLVAVATWDAVARRRLHPVYLWGGGLFILSIPLRVVVAKTSAWQSFALRLVG
jgi:hypothetical protein